jgi:hypothetical protein
MAIFLGRGDGGDFREGGDALRGIAGRLVGKLALDEKKGFEHLYF